MVIESVKSTSQTHKYPRFLPWAIGILTTGGVVFVILTILRTIGPPPPQGNSNLSAVTVPVTRETLAVEIEATGTIEPVQSVNISPERPGILKQLLVEQGMNVKKGQILAVMDNEEVGAEVAKAKAELQEAQANLEEATIRIPQEVIQAQNRLAQSEASLKEAQAKLQYVKETLPREIEQAQADVTEANSRFQLANSRLKRNENLLDEGAITLDYYDQLTDEYLTTKANLRERKKRLEQLQSTQIHQISEQEQVVAQLQAKVAEDRHFLQQKQGTQKSKISQLQALVATAEAEVQRLQIQYQDTIIKAPFNGIITQRYTTEGAFVTPQTSASNTVSATSSSILALAKGLEVLVKVPEIDLVLLKPEQPVEIVADAFNNEVFQGKVKRIAPEAIVEQNVTSFEVALDLLTGQDKLLSKMNVNVTFIAQEIDDALVIPTISVVKKEGKTGVMVFDFQTRQPEFQPIEIGLVIDDQTQVLSGLNENDRVFIKSVQQHRKLPFLR